MSIEMNRGRRSDEDAWEGYDASGNYIFPSSDVEPDDEAEAPQPPPEEASAEPEAAPQPGTRKRDVIHLRPESVEPDDDARNDAEEPAEYRDKRERRDSNSSSARDGRKMKIEWFDEAAQLALEDSSEPLIDDTLDEGAFSVIYGDSNTGKTFVVLDKAFAVATGHPWNGKRTKRGLVIYVCVEGGKRITRRVAALKKHHLDVSAPPLFALIRYPIDLRSGDADAKALLALVREAEKECGVKCVWIIVDTLSRAMAGGDENGSVDMGRVVASADFIRSQTGAHFSYVHHTGKDAARGARGHSLLRAATDTEVETTPGAIEITKQRDMESGQKYAFALTDVILGEDAAGRTIKSAVVEWSDTPIVIEEKASGKNNEAAALKKAFSAAYERLADSVEKSAGFDGAPVRKVTVDAVRDEMKSRGYLDKDEKNRVTAAGRKAFGRAKMALLDAKRFIEADGLVWRI